MHCPACAHELPGIRFRCPHCRRLQPAFWLNFYSLGLWVVILLMNVIHLRFGPQNLLRIQDPPPPLRLYLQLVHLGSWILVLAIVVLLVLGLRKSPLPTFIMSGKALAVVTYVMLVLSLLGVASGYAIVLGEMHPVP